MLAVNVIVSSGTFLVAKRTLVEFPPLVLALFRFLLATAVLWPLVRITQPRPEILPADRPRFLVLGLFAVPLNQGLFLLGMKWASASHAALLYALGPAFVMLIGALRAHQRPTLAQVTGVTIAFAGVLLLLLERGLHFDPHSVQGDLIVLVAVVAWSAYLVGGRMLTRRYGPWAVTSDALLAGTLLYLPVGLVALRGFHWEAVSRTAWLGLLYLALLTSVVTYVVWFWALQYLKAATLATVTNLQPIITAGLAWLFLHERLPAGFLLSMALVLTGIWLTRLGPETREPPRLHAPSPSS